MIKIKFFKRILIIITCAISALCYVHQEVEIMRTSLIINKHEKEVSFLLDQHRSLVYNLSRLESPKRIEDRLTENEIVLCMPRAGNKKNFGWIDSSYAEEAAGASGKVSFLASIFDRFSAKAEAKVIK